MFGLLIALSGTYRGLQVRDSSRELGRLTTVAVVQSIFLVIFAERDVRDRVLAAGHLMTHANHSSKSAGSVNRFGAQIVHDGLDMTVEQRRGVRHRRRLGLGQVRAAAVHPRACSGRRPAKCCCMGRDLTQLSIAELKQVKAGYGVTFQQGALFSSLTVLQNVQLPMLEHLRSVAARARGAGAAQGAAGRTCRTRRRANIPRSCRAA